MLVQFSSQKLKFYAMLMQLYISSFETLQSLYAQDIVIFHTINLHTHDIIITITITIIKGAVFIYYK